MDMIGDSFFNDECNVWDCYYDCRDYSCSTGCSSIYNKLAILGIGRANVIISVWWKIFGKNLRGIILTEAVSNREL